MKPNKNITSNYKSLNTRNFTSFYSQLLKLRFLYVVVVAEIKFLSSCFIFFLFVGGDGNFYLNLGKGKEMDILDGQNQWRMAFLK